MTETQLTIPPGSIVIAFRHGEGDGPSAIVIGRSHVPYYLFADGHLEIVSEGWTGAEASH
jgi:hypothetical protein